MTLLASVAAVLGVPEPLVERSARAWADATGHSFEEVLANWEGGGPASEEVPPDALIQKPEHQQAEMASRKVKHEGPSHDPSAPPERVAEPAAVSGSPSVLDPAYLTETAGPPAAVVSFPTAGITERTGYFVPTWLGVLLLFVPAFGLIYLALGGGAAECGTGTALRPDRVTGMIVNCDGTPFEGRGTTAAGTDFIAMGESVYAECAGCHGFQGGGGAGPPLTGVFTTFRTCGDHIEWVTLGSSGLQAEGRSTYGDTDKPIRGNMPPFGDSLAEEQLAAVVAFERVRFGGGDTDDVLVDCGLRAPLDNEQPHSDQ